LLSSDAGNALMNSFLLSESFIDDVLDLKFQIASRLRIHPMPMKLPLRPANTNTCPIPPKRQTKNCWLFFIPSELIPIFTI
jgi:hypothetical protein